MATYYSILSAVIRPEIQEKISVGLLCVTDKKVLFSFSKNKLSLVKKLLDNQSLYQYLTETIKQIETAVADENAKIADSLGGDVLSNHFGAGYLSYMNRYSNNLIHFSQVVQNDILMESDELFSFLFNKYVDCNEPIQKKTKAITAVKEAFYPTIKKYYNTNRVITKQEIPQLPVSIEIDIIGRNEIPVFAQIIDFERSMNSINHDALTLHTLLNIYDSHAKSFIVGNEPNKSTHPKNHDAWNELRLWNMVTFLPINEIELIKDYAIEHGVVPLFE